MRRVGLLAATTCTLAGCALKGDVRRVEEQLAAFRVETARADSARAVLLDETLAEIILVQQRTIDSLFTFQRRLESFQGDMRTDMTAVHRQLVQIQELTGQSQQRLTELHAQLEQRSEFMFAPQGPAGTDTTGAAQVGAPDVGAQELHDLALQQLRRGSPQTARAGFEMLVETYPDDPLVASAVFFIGETWEGSNADSAAVSYMRVADDFPDARHAPTALYRLGLMAERSGEIDTARSFYQRVLAAHPRSDEALLARAKLNTPDR